MSIPTPLLKILHLSDVGLDVQWYDVDVSNEDGRWGSSREYFTVPTYRLPIGIMAHMVDD